MEDVPDDITEVFLLPADSSLAKVKEQEPDIKKLRMSRADSGCGTLGKNVIEICRAADIVYMGLHGENGENGRMQALFDVLEIKYTGSGYLASALAMNKSLAKMVMKQHGILTPQGITVNINDIIIVNINVNAVMITSVPAAVNPFFKKYKNSFSH